MKIEITWPDTVPLTEINAAFLQGMADRLATSWFKYGAMAEAYPAKLDAVKSLGLRLDRYAETGNTEFLMDAANFALIEFAHPKHPRAAYAPTDVDGSPGRVGNDGRITHGANTIGRENVNRGGSNLVTSGGFYTHEGD